MSFKKGQSAEHINFLKPVGVDLTKSKEPANNESVIIGKPYNSLIPDAMYLELGLDEDNSYRELYETVLTYQPDFLPKPLKMMPLEEKLQFEEYVILLMAYRITRDNMAIILGMKLSALNSYIHRHKLASSHVAKNCAIKGAGHAKNMLKAMDNNTESIEKALTESVITQQFTASEGNKLILEYMNANKGRLNALEMAHLNKSMK